MTPLDDRVSKLRAILADAKGSQTRSGIAGDDTLGRIITAVNPWARRYCYTWGLLAVLIFTSNLWGAYNQAGSVLEVDAWIVAHDQLFVLRIMVGAAVAALPILMVWYFVRSVFKRRS
jgi:hypothetical protein